VLRPLQGIFQPGDYPDLLVGLGEPDDAAVWRLDAERALVITTDFFTPVVDDPYDYGAIAAANALSDVYAMGGVPFLALNIAALPLDLPPEIGAEIMRGGAEKAREAGVVLAGGHTVQDKEPKYGLVVLGFVHPEHILNKGGVQPGDTLLITKPLGFGTVTTALKRDLADPQDIAEAVSWMKRLNKTAASLASAFGLRGGTDITGFSLLGHALEAAGHSGVGMRFYFDQIPFTRGARRYAAEWIFPGGSLDNRAYYGNQVTFDPQIDEHSRMLLFDAQTSGGLLLAVPAEKTADFLAQAARVDQPVWIVGQAFEGAGIEVLNNFKAK
jgi:selenide, water dikinase